MKEKSDAQKNLKEGVKEAIGSFVETMEHYRVACTNMKRICGNY
jgi:predicted DNA-binding protein